MTDVPALVETFVGPARKGGWALQAEFYGDFSPYQLGQRLDYLQVLAWMQSNPPDHTVDGNLQQPGLRIPRHDPFVVFRAPRNLGAIHLTARDRETLEDAAAGLSAAEAAAAHSHPSDNRVRKRRTTVIGKLGARSTQDAITRAIILSEIEAEATPDATAFHSVPARALCFLGYASLGLTEDVIGKRFKLAAASISDSQRRLRDELSTAEVPVRSRPQATATAFRQGMFVVGGRYDG